MPCPCGRLPGLQRQARRSKQLVDLLSPPRSPPTDSPTTNLPGSLQGAKLCHLCRWLCHRVHSVQGRLHHGGRRVHSLRNNVRNVLQHHDVRDLPSGRAAHRDNRTLHERRCVCGRLWMSWDAGQLIPHALKHHAPSNPSTPTPMPSAGMCPPAGTVKSNDACVAGETCCWAALGRGCVAPMGPRLQGFPTAGRQRSPQRSDHLRASPPPSLQRSLHGGKLRRMRP